MKARKTIQVKPLVDYANEQLKRTDDYATMKFKCAICAMVEKILHTSNNYQGFMFIDNNDSAIDTTGYYSRRYYFNL